MNPYAETVFIDLSGIETDEQLFDLLGDVFEFGGPAGNVSVVAVNQGSGWGRNWHALNDSLCCIDTGGIWGISRIFHLPLLIQLKYSEEYRSANPKGYSYLADILESNRRLYAEHGKQFDFKLE